MTDALLRLTARALGTASLVQPLIPTRHAPRHDELVAAERGALVEEAPLGRRARSAVEMPNAGDHAERARQSAFDPPEPVPPGPVAESSPVLELAAGREPAARELEVGDAFVEPQVSVLEHDREGSSSRRAAVAPSRAGATDQDLESMLQGERALSGSGEHSAGVAGSPARTFGRVLTKAPSAESPSVPSAREPRVTERRAAAQSSRLDSEVSQRSALLLFDEEPARPGSMAHPQRDDRGAARDSPAVRDPSGSDLVDAFQWPAAAVSNTGERRPERSSEADGLPDIAALAGPGGAARATREGTIVRVNIGRIDVYTAPPERPARRATADANRAPSLEGFLRSRGAGP
jgi:hypothetical protein